MDIPYFHSKFDTVRLDRVERPALHYIPLTPILKMLVCKRNPKSYTVNRQMRAWDSKYIVFLITDAYSQVTVYFLNMLFTFFTIIFLYFNLYILM